MTLPAFTDVMARVCEARNTGARRCRACGCTDAQACTHDTFGPCWWIEDDLCSHCGAPAIVAHDYDVLAAQDFGVNYDEQLTALAAWAQRARIALEHAATTPASAFEP